jgi:RNA polymerase sigma-70 factor (ECF subfamily)
MSASSAATVQQIYLDHHGWLQGWLRQRLGCDDTAADLAQDTFVRVLRRTMQGQCVHEPRAFLGTVAHGLLVNHWRRLEIERAYLEALASHPEPHAASPEERQLVLETLYEIDAVLEKLPERARKAFLLAQLEGLTYRQIAAELDVSERMVKKYMARAMFACLMLGQR